jgi:hypothetical protein
MQNTTEAREDRASVPGKRDRGATSQYLKTADSIATKHLIGPAQSDLGRFFVVCASKRQWHRLKRPETHTRV